MISKHYDKILLGAALLLSLVVFGFTALRPPDPLQTTEFAPLRPANTFVVSESQAFDLSVREWPPPPSQSAGPEWVFDVFTPPVILFDEETGEFVLPGDPDSPAPPGFDIELVSIQEELYRIQLVGYFGRQGDLLVTLENRQTGEQVLGREGREFQEMGITIRSVWTEKIRVPHDGDTLVTIDVAFVVIDDERLGQEVTLRSDYRKKDFEATAIFQSIEDPNARFRAQLGDSFSHGGARYHVDALTPPTSAVVTRSGLGEEGGVITKTLRAARTGSTSSDETIPRRSNATPAGQSTWGTMP